LASLVRNLQGWVQTWIEGISATPPAFDDPFKGATAAARDHITSHLRSKVDRLIAIVDREQAKSNGSLQHHRSKTIFGAHSGSNEGIIAALHTSYDGPGVACQNGPRHDNDHLDIGEIRIAPTHEELISRMPPFLPANLHAAPHPLPPESMERLLDIQFRLLREELTYVHIVCLVPVIVYAYASLKRATSYICATYPRRSQGTAAHEDTSFGHHRQAWRKVPWIYRWAGIGHV
jgi:hypothetical protein